MFDSSLFDFVVESSKTMYAGNFSLPSSPADSFSLSSYLADILCDPIDHQHLHVLGYSASGKGKSMVFIAVAEALSIELAKRCGTSPEDHFTLDNIVVADSEKTNQKLLEFKRNKVLHPILIIDESGIETNARRAMSKNNVKAVKISVIMRELGMCVFRNVQNIELLDAGIRKQITHELSIETPKHQLGYNDCKFKIVKDRPGEKKNWSVYPTSADGFTKYKRIRIGLPSIDLLQQYMRLKGMATSDFFESELTRKEDNSKVQGRRNVGETEAWCKRALDLHYANPALSKAKCVLLAGGNRETFDKYLLKNNIASWRPVKKDDAEC